MKRSDRMVRNYRDSQAKLVKARRQYKDALRRFRDAEGEEQLSKFKALKAKIDEKLAMFSKDHPDLIKYAKKFAVISARVLSIMSGIVAGGLAAIDIKVIRTLKKHGFELKEIAGMVPNKIGLLISSLAAVVLGFAGWAGKRAEEDINK